jgi:hypothetical protein
MQFGHHAFVQWQVHECKTVAQINWWSHPSSGGMAYLLDSYESTSLIFTHHNFAVMSRINYVHILMWISCKWRCIYVIKGNELLPSVNGKKFELMPLLFNYLFLCSKDVFSCWCSYDKFLTSLILFLVWHAIYFLVHATFLLFTKCLFLDQ